MNKIITTLDQMHSFVDIMQRDNINISVVGEEPHRAVFPTSKLDLTMEFIVFKNGGFYIGLARNGGADTRLSDEIHTQLINLIEDTGYMVSINQSNVRWKSDDHIADIKAIHALVEGAEFVPNGGSSWRKTNFNQRFNTIAKHWYTNWENNDTTAFNRDILDTMNTRVAVNLRTNELKHGEHVVPVDYLYRKSLDMYAVGKTVENVTNFLTRNCKIVYIRSADAIKLDFELKLKTVMTEGWVDGDSPFARLDFAGIKIEGNMINE